MANNEIDVPLHFDPQTLRLVSLDQLKSMTMMIVDEQARRNTIHAAVTQLEKLNAVYDKKMNFDVENAIVRVRGVLDSHDANRRIKGEAGDALRRLSGLSFDNVTCKAGTVKWDNVISNASIRVSRELPFYRIRISHGPGISTRAGRGDVFGSGDLKWTIDAGTEWVRMEVQVVDGCANLIIPAGGDVRRYCPGIFEAMRRFVVAKFNPSEFVVSGMSPTDAAASRCRGVNLWINGES
jgi:hypothetical protein